MTFNLKAIGIGGVITVLILLVVLFQVSAEVIPDVQDAGDDLNDTGAPLASFFASDGIVILLIMAGLLFAVMASTGFKTKR